MDKLNGSEERTLVTYVGDVSLRRDTYMGDVSTLVTYEFKERTLVTYVGNVSLRREHWSLMWEM